MQYVRQIRSDGFVQWFAPLVCNPATGPCAPGTTFAIPATAPGVFSLRRPARNIVYGPGFNDTDFSLTKNTKLTERFTAQFRAEVFDLFNHPNFGQPGRVAQVGSTSFG